MELPHYEHQGKRYVTVQQLSGMMDVHESSIYSAIKENNYSIEKIKIESEDRIKKYFSYEDALSIYDFFMKKRKESNLPPSCTRGKEWVHYTLKRWMETQIKEEKPAVIPKYVRESLLDENFMAQLSHLYKYVRDSNSLQPSK